MARAGGIHIKAGDRCFIVGTTGSGKSYLSQKLLASRADVVIVDPKHQYKWEHAKPTHGKEVVSSDFREVVRHTGPEPLTYRPSLAECAAGIPWFWVWVWERSNTLVFVDEVQPITKPVAVPYEMARCIQMGRSRNIGVWCATQRPARVPVVLLSEAEHDFIFRLRNPQDLKRMAEYTAPEILDDPATGHACWYYGDRDQILVKTEANRIVTRRE